ncbi:cupin domain-containing protein [Micromonospora zhanjiangensis]|uniref:Cupin domain-containing protein n=1 Tax=Micromonospora zhanjiangensis TaxID=1522057 RepID=A0ABV8KRY3_9ACTN
MRKLAFADVVGGAIPAGRLVDRGGFRRYDEPGFRTHDEPGTHTHTVPEVFCIYQGSGTIEINGAAADRFTAGDVLLIEPGEDHHLISDGDVPLVFTWMHLQE